MVGDSGGALGGALALNYAPIGPPSAAMAGRVIRRAFCSLSSNESRRSRDRTMRAVGPSDSHPIGTGDPRRPQRRLASRQVPSRKPSTPTNSNAGQGRSFLAATASGRSRTVVVVKESSDRRVLPLTEGSREEVMHPRNVAWLTAGFRLDLDTVPDCPPALIDGERRMYEELDTTSPLDPYLLPVELLWGRMPEPLRAPGIAPVIEAGLARIYRGRAWFQSYWRPLRNYRLDIRPDGNPQLVEPVLRRTEVEALTGAAVVAGTTVLERCIDLGEHLARVILGEPPRTIDPRFPILRLRVARPMIRRLLEEPAVVASFLEKIESDPEVRSLRQLAIDAGARELADDQFPLISQAYGAGPESEQIAALIRHCVAHGRDLGDHLDHDNRLFLGFASAMQTVFGRLQWLLLANTAGAACPEWYESAQ